MSHNSQGVGPPLFTPTEINQHYADTSNTDKYISSGTVSSADWGNPLDSFGDEVVAKIFSPQKTTGVGTHTFPDLTTGVPIGVAGGNLSGTGDITLTHGVDALLTLVKVDHTGTGASTVNNDSAGGFLFGNVDVAGTTNSLTNLTSSAKGNLTFGDINATTTTSGSTIDNAANGSLVFGKTESTGNGVADIKTTATSGGALVFGYSKSSNGTSTIQSDEKGTLTGGFCDSQSVGQISNIKTLKKGSFAFGYCQVATGITTGSSTIQTDQEGSMAFGYCKTSGNFVAEISTGGVSKSGSIAMGSCLASSSNASIKAQGNGSFCHGFANNSDIHATGDNCFQFGPGVNTLSDSFQVGNGGVRFKGTTGTPGTPQNGDVFVNAGYVYIRSNGVTVKI